jgi:hypothetical protein
VIERIEWLRRIAGSPPRLRPTRTHPSSRARLFLANRPVQSR